MKNEYGDRPGRSAPYPAALGVFITSMGIIEAMQRTTSPLLPVLLLLAGAFLIGVAVKIFGDALVVLGNPRK